jgi:hypothetical protein
MTAVCAFSLPFFIHSETSQHYFETPIRASSVFTATTKQSLYPNDPVPNNTNTNTTTTLSPIRMLAQFRISPMAACQLVCGPSQYTANEGHLQRSK